MEKIWLRAGLDLRMVTYECVATGADQGRDLSILLVQYCRGWCIVVLQNLCNRAKIDRLWGTYHAQ